MDIQFSEAKLSTWVLVRTSAEELFNLLEGLDGTVTVKKNFYSRQLDSGGQHIQVQSLTVVPNKFSVRIETAVVTPNQGIEKALSAHEELINLLQSIDSREGDF